MKKIALSLLISGVLASGSALAAPIGLPGGPLFLQFNDAEQFSVGNNISSPGGTNEGLWGIVQISSIQQGVALPPLGSDIAGGGTTIFNNGQNGGNQILGVFYGLTTASSSVITGTRLVGGHLDLYWHDSSSQNVGLELLSGANITTKRTAQNQYTGFTNGAGTTFLARYDFSPGIATSNLLLPDSTTTDFALITPGVANGSAQSYLDLNVGAGGAWASLLDTNFFTLNAGTPGTPWSTFGLSPKDLRLDTVFTANGASAWSAGPDIVGLRTNDPARTVAVPEPGSLALVGLALAAMGGWRRRRSSAC